MSLFCFVFFVPCLCQGDDSRSRPQARSWDCLDCPPNPALQPL
ncbi:MAG: hypothetical protein VKK80_01435 [Prochlorothrix sp.]|nr:hypothetical protein [Prochlorothrix sp.]